MSDQELLWSASLPELIQGYRESADSFTCLCCGSRFEKGLIYQADGLLYEAGRFIRRHLEQVHESVFAYLIRLDKGATGLTDQQRRLLELFYQGQSDAQVQRELGIGSASTIRNHRFLLKEKERQARLFLAIMELLRTRDSAPAATAESAAPTPVAADQAEGEEAHLIAKYFPFGPDGPLKGYPRREKQRLVILGEIATRFAPGRTYTERQVNEILGALYADYVGLRRALVDYRLLERLPDGSQYWRKAPGERQEESSMERREARRMAKEGQAEAGIYQIRNKQNGKVLVESTRNLKTLNGKQFQLELGSHQNKRLQQEWREFGPQAFAFEVLAVLKRPETGFFDEADELKRMKAAWLERLQPYGDRGYNTQKDDE